MTKEHEVDLGRRGFLKIFGATAVGVAVAGPAVAEAAQKLLEAEVYPEPWEIVGDPEPNHAILPKYDHPLKDLARIYGEPVPEPVKHLMLQYTKHLPEKRLIADNWISIPFQGDIIELEVPRHFTRLPKLYVVQNRLDPGGMRADDYRDHITTVRLLPQRDPMLKAATEYFEPGTGDLTMAKLRHFSHRLRVEVGGNVPVPGEARALFDNTETMDKLTEWIDDA